jgi:hypothetical protein
MENEELNLQIAKIAMTAKIAIIEIPKLFWALNMNLV